MTGESILYIIKGRQMTPEEIDEYFDGEEAFEEKYGVKVVSEFYGEHTFMGKILYRGLAYAPPSIHNFEKDWIMVVSEEYSYDPFDNLPSECKFQ